MSKTALEELADEFHPTSCFYAKITIFYIIYFVYFNLF